MNYYYRYHFSIVEDGKKINLFVCANNAYSAHSRVKKLYPRADKIQVKHTERM